MAEHINEIVPESPPERYPAPDLKSVRLSYDPEGDILIVLFERGKLATSLDRGEFWLRIDLITGDVYGVEIENFERAFLKRHQDVASVWQQAKPVPDHPSGNVNRRLLRKILSSLPGTPWSAQKSPMAHT